MHEQSLALYSGTVYCSVNYQDVVPSSTPSVLLIDPTPFHPLPHPKCLAMVVFHGDVL